MKNKILKLLSKEKDKPLRLIDLCRSLAIKRNQITSLRKILKRMVREGTIIQIKGDQYSLPKETELITGTLRGNPKGFGFVIPSNKNLTDIYIHRENMSTALDGDTVLVRYIRPYRRYRKVYRGPEGEIVDVLKRANENIVGTLRKSGHFYYVIPNNLSIFQDIYVDRENIKEAKIDQKVVVKIIEWKSKHLNPEGKIIKILGDSKEIATDLISVIEQFRLPEQFPRKAIAETKKIPVEIADEQFVNRLDLRNEEIFTIDPETAKDFDDAISLRQTKKGEWVLGVHIADVASYVKKNSALDLEALKRGNSVYLLDKVIPMLPKKLSNIACSLKPNVDRLTKSVIMKFNKEGILQKYDIADSIINSKKRFTYNEVQQILDGKRRSKFKEILLKMADLSQILLKRRLQRGSFDFDLAEVKVILDRYGNISSIEKQRKDLSHSIIEEFMIAANETVARHLTRKRIKTIYRIHEQPDPESLNEFSDKVRHFGYKISKQPTAYEIQRLLNSVKNKPEAYAINLALLRSLKLAEYSTENVGHFGLASEQYLHFTSPIRRYPDLVVHRSLKDFDRKKKNKGHEKENRLAEIAEHCSVTERNAEEAEEEIIKIATLRFLHNLSQSKYIKALAGTIIDIKSSGLIVHLSDFLIKGTIKFSTMRDDFYRFRRRSQTLIGVRKRKIYRPGQQVKVRIKNVDFIKKEIELTLA